MAPDPAGWYRDPKRPGMARYWDGHAWVDVDQVVDGHPAQIDPDPSPLTSGPRLVAQRRAGDDHTDPTVDTVDESRPEQLDASPSTSEPESRQD
jgi:hypothetical protein